VNNLELLVICSIISIPLLIVAAVVLIYMYKENKKLNDELDKLGDWEHHWYTRACELSDELDALENPIQVGLK